MGIYEGIPIPSEIDAVAQRAALYGFVDTVIQTFPGQVAAIFGDANDLKQKNDSKGHIAGDDYLETTLHTLNRCIRHESDTNQRLGRPADIVLGGIALNTTGDEFLILLQGVRRHEYVQGFIARAQAALQRQSIDVAMGGRIHQPGETARELLEDIDARMRRNKLEQVPVPSPRGEAELRHLRHVIGNTAVEGLTEYNVAKHLAALDLRDSQLIDEDTVGMSLEDSASFRIVA